METIKKILRCVCIKCSKLKLDKDKYKHVLNMSSKKRWDYIFKIAQKIKRCGEDHQHGCGTKAPKKIYKQDLASIYAEWENNEGELWWDRGIDGCSDLFESGDMENPCLENENFNRITAIYTGRSYLGHALSRLNQKPRYKDFMKRF